MENIETCSYKLVELYFQILPPHESYQGLVLAFVWEYLE